MFTTIVRRRHYQLALLFGLILGLGNDWVRADDLEYEVDLSDARNHYVTVRLECEVVGDQTILMMPVWTPGSYLIREYARHVDSVRAWSEKGQDLDVKKVRKNRWQVNTNGAERLNFEYRVYCNEPSVRTNFVGHEYAVLNGAPTFVTPIDRMDKPHIVQLKLPQPWTRSATSLAATEQGHRYRAEDYDELVDSPIVAGNISIHPFMVGDVPHYLVNVGDQGTWDGNQAAADLAKVVAAHQQIWGTVPYDRYWFINVIGAGGGGLEHNNGCLMMSGHWTFREPGRYRRWLTLASHEFFHTWNVRRLRPRPLVQYDYENEVYTPSLWVAEGVTSYYEILALVRAGMIGEAEFLNGLSGDIRSVQTTPGRKVQSLAESSFDTWIKFYRPDENASNTRISYYSKGAVVAWLLDAEIRSSTSDEKSLDDVLRILYERFVETGFTPEDFRGVCNEVAGKSLDAFFERAVESTQELDYRPALDWWGLRLPAFERMQQAAEETTPDSASRGAAWLGVQAQDNVVSRVVADSPATRFGINTDDELLAIDGFRITRSVDDLLRHYEPGDVVELLLARQGRILKFNVELAARPAQNWSLDRIREPEPSQQAHFESWTTGQKVEIEISDDANADDGSDSDAKEESGELDQSPPESNGAQNSNG